jgi:hypothetical protein
MIAQGAMAFNSLGCPMYSPTASRRFWSHSKVLPRLMRVLAAANRIAGLPVFHTRQDFQRRHAIAFRLIGRNHPWGLLTAFEERAEEFCGRGLLPSTSNRKIHIFSS